MIKFEDVYNFLGRCYSEKWANKMSIYNYCTSYDTYINFELLELTESSDKKRIIEVKVFKKKADNEYTLSVRTRHGYDECKISDLEYSVLLNRYCLIKEIAKNLVTKDLTESYPVEEVKEKVDNIDQLDD